MNVAPTSRRGFGSVVLGGYCHGGVSVQPLNERRPRFYFRMRVLRLRSDWRIRLWGSRSRSPPTRTQIEGLLRVLNAPLHVLPLLKLNRGDERRRRDSTREIFHNHVLLIRGCRAWRVRRSGQTPRPGLSDNPSRSPDRDRESVGADARYRLDVNVDVRLDGRRRWVSVTKSMTPSPSGTHCTMAPPDGHRPGDRAPDIRI